MGRAEFISPHRVVAAVPRGLTTSHLIYPLSRVMIRFILCCEYNYA